MDSLIALLIIPVTLLIIIFAVKYTACVLDYISERRSLMRKIKNSDENSKQHWKKRLRWESYLLIPFVGRYMRDNAFIKNASSHRKRY